MYKFLYFLYNSYVVYKNNIFKKIFEEVFNASYTRKTGA